MKQFFISFLFLLFFFTAFSQSNKIYFNTDGKYVRDPQKADHYIIIEKLQDSAYLSEQYNMSNHLQKKGTYTDELLTKPNGKFFYYEDHLSYSKIKDAIKTDTGVVLKSSGYYLNGLKAGAWVQYDMNGNKESISVYENDKLNGIFQQFDSTGTIISSGNFVNDKKEGEWNNYQSGVELPAYKEVYLHNKLIKKEIHLVNAKPTKDFNKYATKTLTRYLDSTRYFKILFKLSEEGKVENVLVYSNLSQVTNEIVTNTFLNAPQFIPASYDNKPSKEQYIFDLKIGFSSVVTVTPVSSQLIGIPVNGNNRSILPSQRIP
jgi:antitoxin component YwqK of YwqJK toxin-antitoxin module